MVTEEKIWSDVVTWLLVFIGWAVVHRATLIRDRRKEKREISMQICTDIAELQSAAIDFHTSPHFNARKSTDLAQQVERIILRLQKPPLNELKIAREHMVTLRRRITKRNIDLTDFKSQPDDGEIIFGIRNAVTDLTTLIESNKECVWK